MLPCGVPDERGDLVAAGFGVVVAQVAAVVGGGDAQPVAVPGPLAGVDPQHRDDARPTPPPGHAAAPIQVLQIDRCTVARFDGA